GLPGHAMIIILLQINVEIEIKETLTHLGLNFYAKQQILPNCEALGELYANQIYRYFFADF
ncbi:hypothetical protein, partial [Dickeya dadantii]|uniref:hypothetical protein n=1 Tax=Dickeya dadantii TaxID=204038 RepID=UPI001C1314BD